MLSNSNESDITQSFDGNSITKVKDAKTCKGIFVDWLIHFIDESSTFYGICGIILIILLSVAASTIITLCPQHDIILNPEYWYEPLPPIIIGYFAISTGNIIIDCWTVMKIDLIMTWTAYFELFCLTSLGFLTPYSSIYLVWVHFLRYRYPMPFIGQICLAVGYICKCVSLWFIFPRHLRHNQMFRKRLLAYLSLFPLYFIIGIGYTQISSLVFMVPDTLQWTLGICLPIFKKFNTWISIKVAFKAAGSNDVSAKLAMICSIGSIHAFSVSLLLGSKITFANACLIAMIDCIPNIFCCAKLLKPNQIDTKMDNSSNNEALKCLILTEMLKTIIPIIYVFSFLIAYFGPNANVLGNVQNDYWQYEKVDDVSEKFSRIGMFFIFDVGRVIIFSALIWRYCKFDIYGTYCNIIRHYGVLIFFYITGCLSVVMCCYLKKHFLSFNHNLDLIF